MIRKKVAVLFVFLACIMFVASTVIPHHHHHSNVCFRHSHCQHDNSGEESGEHHHHNGKPECCSLNITSLIPAGPSRELTAPVDDNQYKRYSDFQFLLRTTFSSWLDPEVLNCESPGNDPFYSSLVCSIYGLRAPPVV